jgi:hypothetical protein
MRLKPMDKYARVIRSGRFTEIEIVYFRKLLNGYRKTNADRTELFELFERSGPYQITREQTQKGIEWLRDKAFCRNGRIRKTQPFDSDQLQVITKFSRFEFVGLYDLMAESPYPHPEYHQYIPIYRVISRDGKYFDYSPATWGEVKFSTEVRQRLKRVK